MAFLSWRIFFFDFLPIVFIKYIIRNKYFHILNLIRRGVNCVSKWRSWRQLSDKRCHELINGHLRSKIRKTVKFRTLIRIFDHRWPFMISWHLFIRKLRSRASFDIQFPPSPYNEVRNLTLNDPKVVIWAQTRIFGIENFFRFYCSFWAIDRENWLSFI